MAFVEAQAAGLPVIGAMREGVASVVADGRTGLLVPEGSVAHFAGAIDALLKDPDRRRTMGAMAGEHARVNHDVRTAGQSFCRALERLIA
jgi:glycosyltransferase involved in cell wall biosynthesis